MIYAIRDPGQHDAKKTRLLVIEVVVYRSRFDCGGGGVRDS
jgi:hypothetical protein